MDYKKRTGKALVLSAIVSAALATASFAAPDPNFHIYLAFGQSNMEGQGTIEQQDKTVDSRFQVMWSGDNGYCANRTKGSWYDAVPPLASCDGKLGPADYFGRSMVESAPEGVRIGVIVVAVAGCDIQLFEKDNYKSYVSSAQSWMTSRINNYGGNPYGRLVDLAKAAQQEGVIKGILLHQGETNSGQNNWPSRVKGIYDNLVKDLGLDANTPLVAGEVHPNGSCKGMNSIIAQLPQQSKNFYVASAQGITGMLQDGQNVHFDAAGYRTLGKEYAKQMLKAIGPITAVAESSSSVQAPASSSSSVVAPTSSSDIATVSSSSSQDALSSSAIQSLELSLGGITDIRLVEVYSTLGQEVARFNHAHAGYAEALQLCRQKLPAGNYIVRIQGAGLSKTVPLHVNK